MLELAAPHSTDHFERNFVGGDWIFSREGYGFDIYDPSNSEVIAAVPLSSHFDVSKAASIAAAALAQWSARPQADRGNIVLAALDAIERGLDEIAALEARDTGSPVRYVKRQISDAVASVRQHVAASRSSSQHQVGVIGVVLSWSGPFTLSCREILPSLAAGNTFVVKPSLRAPLSSVLFAEILQRSALPAGVFNLVQGAGIDVGAALVGQRGLAQIWFQGSRETARSVARAASVTKADLRLCLRRPNLTVVDAAADLESAADHVASETLLNTGAAGSGTQVLHAHTDIYKPLMALVEQRLRQIRYGSPADEGTTLGPMIADIYRQARQAAIDGLEKHGATTIFTARAPDERTERMGWFVAPRILFVDEYDHLAHPERPLGPTTITQSIPGYPALLRKGLRESGWNACRVFEAAAVSTQEFFGSRFVPA